MGKIRVYCKKNLQNVKSLVIDGDDFHYLRNVMRLGVGQKFFLFNEDNGEFECAVRDINKKNLDVDIVMQTRTPNDEKIADVELIFTPIRHTRLDFLVEKTTELGVSTLSPVITKNTSVKDANTERLSNIAKEATEQSRRLSIPKINPVEKFMDKVLNFDFDNRVLVYFDERQDVKENTVDVLRKFKEKPISFIVGPEGGFSEDEFEMLSKTPAISVSLGSLILRAETAGIVAIALHNIGIEEQ